MAFLTHEEADRQIEQTLISPSPVAIEKFREYLSQRGKQPEIKEGEAAPFFGEGEQPKQRLLPVRTPRT